MFAFYWKKIVVNKRYTDTYYIHLHIHTNIHMNISKIDFKSLRSTSNVNHWMDDSAGQ